MLHVSTILDVVLNSIHLLFQVSDDSIQADWRQTFADTVGSYHHFEWAVGTT
jgi:hypothetical protein